MHKSKALLLCSSSMSWLQCYTSKQLLLELPPPLTDPSAQSHCIICVHFVPLIPDRAVYIATEFGCADCHSCSIEHCVLLQILGALHAIHAVAVFFKLMSPALYSPGAGRRGRGMYTLVILNSLNLAVACRYACCPHASVSLFFLDHWGIVQLHTSLVFQMHPM